MDWLKRWMAKRAAGRPAVPMPDELPIDFVSAAAARCILAEITASDLREARGFTPRKGGVLTRRIDDDLVQLVDMNLMKGQQFGFRWGVSLSFLPHAWMDGARWHRTQANARFDLFRWADELDGALAASPPPIDGIHGEAIARKEAIRAWEVCRPVILAWLDRMRSLPEVAEEAVRQAREPRTHDPDPRLVEVFVRARMGRADEAARALDRLIIEDHDEGLLHPHDGLRSALSRVGP